MKAPFVVAVALVALTFAGVAHAGPTSTLYLTVAGNQSAIEIVQANSVIQTIPTAYNRLSEFPIAVSGDIRTTGDFHNPNFAGSSWGGQYTLAGTPTGTIYVLPSAVSSAYDSTSDGSHNYLVDGSGGIVYQTARDYTNPTALFSTGTSYEFGITYDAANHSLWLSSYYGSTVADYSLSGTLLSSFSTGHTSNGALAMDPADHTLWLVNNQTGDANYGYLEQYSQAGVLLSIGPYVGYAYGGEFDLAPTTPEPGTLIMFGSGILGLAGVLRRKINL
jgi:hypothetical protein